LIRSSVRFGLRLDAELVERSLDFVVLVEVALLVDLRVLRLVLVVSPLLEELDHVSVMGARYGLKSWVVCVGVCAKQKACFPVIRVHPGPEVAYRLR
jgi:hypothetical protein